MNSGDSQDQVNDTGNGDRHESEDNKKKRKALSELKPIIALPTVNKLYSIVVSGDFELFWAESTNSQDSNTYPLFASVRDAGRFARTHNVIMMVNRRMNLHQDQPVRNAEDNYLRRFYLRLVDNATLFSRQARLEFLVDISEVSQYAYQ